MGDGRSATQVGYGVVVRNRNVRDLRHRRHFRNVRNVKNVKILGNRVLYHHGCLLDDMVAVLVGVLMTVVVLVFVMLVAVRGGCGSRHASLNE